VLAVVPARQEADRIRDTVAALRSIPRIDEVVVVDSGSMDGTATEAAAGGGRVLVAPGPIGKGDAIEGSLWRLPQADVYVLADGDLGSSAGGIEPLLDEVLAGRADMAVGALPPPATGGFGLVKRAARALIRKTVAFEATEPLSGQRAVTADCLRACRPIARGFGMEVGLTIDAVRMGFRVREVPVDLEHRFTRKDAAGFLHRGRQGLDALRAGVPRALRIR